MANHGADARPDGLQAAVFPSLLSLQQGRSFRSNRTAFANASTCLFKIQQPGLHVLMPNQQRWSKRNRMQCQKRP
jgi:hypothetical protein